MQKQLKMQLKVLQIWVGNPSNEFPTNTRGNTSSAATTTKGRKATNLPWTTEPL